MLRQATSDDLASMLTWRNQSANREASIHSHVISREEHERWWRRVEADPGRRVLVFEMEGVSLGVVSFFDLDLSAPTPRGSWGFYLDHDGTAAAGTTLVAWLGVMREGTRYAFDTLRLEVLTGEVLEGNEAVRAMNRRFRFVEGPASVREVDGRRITVYPIELRRTQWRGGKA